MLQVIILVGLQHVKQLTIILQVYASDLSESGNDKKAKEAILIRVKARIENHIKKRLEEGLSKDTLTEQLHDLTMDGLIPMDINEWCYQKLDELSKEQEDTLSESKDSSSDDLSEVLSPFSFDDAVYHASLCGLALWDSNQSGRKGGSIDLLSNFRHSFDEVSISVSGNIKIIVAHQEDTVYISFMDTDLLEGMF